MSRVVLQVEEAKDVRRLMVHSEAAEAGVCRAEEAEGGMEEVVVEPGAREEGEVGRRTTP